jgi:hypothetical protein
MIEGQDAQRTSTLEARQAQVDHEDATLVFLLSLSQLQRHLSGNVCSAHEQTTTISRAF